MPKEPCSLVKLCNKSYFEAARRLEKRSLLVVNEHFPDKADAKRALLGNFKAQTLPLAIADMLPLGEVERCGIID